jgi:hypothetical protein
MALAGLWENWRSSAGEWVRSFATRVTEQTDTPTEIRELALAHVSGDKVAAAYQRSVLLEKRRTLMERWGRFCAGEEGRIVELRPAIIA